MVPSDNRTLMRRGPSREEQVKSEERTGGRGDQEETAEKQNFRGKWKLERKKGQGQPGQVTRGVFQGAKATRVFKEKNRNLVAV